MKLRTFIILSDYHNAIIRFRILGTETNKVRSSANLDVEELKTFKRKTKEISFVFVKYKDYFVKYTKLYISYDVQLGFCLSFDTVVESCQSNN